MRSLLLSLWSLWGNCFCYNMGLWPGDSATTASLLELCLGQCIYISSQAGGGWSLEKVICRPSNGTCNQRGCDQDWGASLLPGQRQHISGWPDTWPCPDFPWTLCHFSLATFKIFSLPVVFYKVTMMFLGVDLFISNILKVCSGFLDV